MLLREENQALDYYLIEKPAFHAVGKALRVHFGAGENFQAIPAFWRQSADDGVLDRLAEIREGESLLGDVLLGVCTGFDFSQMEFTYLIAIETKQDTISEGFMTAEIPAATWVVFPSVGMLPEAVQSVWTHIFTEFFPASEFVQLEGAPQLELYPPGNPQDARYRCEVWIPVVRKSEQE